MKLKYYLRGLGIGIIVTTIILMISFAMHNKEMTDSEIIERAEELGMVFQEDALFSSETSAEEADTQTMETEAGENSIDIDETSNENDGSSTETAPTNVANTEDNTPANQTEDDSVNPSNEQPIAGNDGSPYVLTIKQGDVCRTICDDLHANGLIDDSEGFRVYLGKVGYASNMSVGQYEIPYGLSYEEIYQILLTGPMQE